MHHRRRLVSSTEGCQATRSPPEADEGRLAKQARHGSATYPLYVMSTAHAHTRPCSRLYIPALMSTLYPPVSIITKCRTGLLQGRKRAPRAHRLQYTPLSWVEASTCVHTHIYTYLHIYIERERDRERLSATRHRRRTYSGKPYRTARCDRRSVVPVHHMCVLQVTTSTHRFGRFTDTPSTLMHSCAIPHRRELHHRTVVDMSDKQIEMLLKRDS